jgi:hypothetical protein
MSYTNPHAQRGASALAWIGFLLIVVILGWQLYLGRTVQMLGIPGVFEIKLGEKQKELIPPRMSELEVGINRGGSDLNDYVATDISDCLAACLQNNSCMAITFNQSSRQCWLKKAAPLRSTAPGFTSSVKIVN